MRWQVPVGVIGGAALLDAGLGVAFAAADHIPAWNGLYFATVTATTVGYGDITPQGWLAHMIAVTIMLTVIPLFAAAFSLFTAALTSVHAHWARAEAQAARRIAADTYKHVTGLEHPHAGGPISPP